MAILVNQHVKKIDEVSAQFKVQGWIGCEYRPNQGDYLGGTIAGLGLVKTLAQK